MTEREHRLTLRGLRNSKKKELSVLTKKRKTSLNTEVLMAIDQYISEWKKSTPEWFEKKTASK